MKTVELHFMPGDECYVKGQTRTCYIDQVIISKKNNGEPEITYTWYNLDFGVDVTELWDEGDFSQEDVGKIVFDSMEEYQKAYPEDFEVPDYGEDEYCFMCESEDL